MPVDEHLDEKQFLLAVRRLADSLGYGAEASPFVGSGVDYAQSRPYLAGDAIRSIDWRVTARTGRAHVKEYEATKRMAVHLVADASASMAAASGPAGRTVGWASKYDWAVRLAGAIALASLARLSPVGLSAGGGDRGDGRGEPRYRPSLSRPQVFQWLHVLRGLHDLSGDRGPSPRPAASLARTLRDADAAADERGVFVVLSDLHDPEAAGVLKVLAGRHDVVALQLHDPAERGRVGGGVFRAREAETGRSFLATGRTRLIDPEPLAADLRRSGVDHLRLDIDQAFLPELRQFLKTRGHAGRARR